MNPHSKDHPQLAESPETEALANLQVRDAHYVRSQRPLARRRSRSQNKVRSANNLEDDEVAALINIREEDVLMRLAWLPEFEFCCRYVGIKRREPGTSSCEIGQANGNSMLFGKLKSSL